MSALHPTASAPQQPLYSRENLPRPRHFTRHHAAIVAVLFMLTGVGGVAAAIDHVRSESDKSSGFGVPSPDDQPKATPLSQSGTPAPAAQLPLSVNVQSDQAGSTATVNGTSTHIGNNDSLTQDYTTGNDGSASVHISMQNNTSADGAHSSQHSSVHVQSSTTNQTKGTMSSQSDEP